MPLKSLRLVASVISSILVMSCSGNSPKSIKQISVHELRELLESDTTLNLIDVRTEIEFQTVRVPHIKARIDFHEVVEQIDTLAFPKDEPVYLICRTGRRSLIAARELRDYGYHRPVNIAGGTVDWIESGYPAIKR